MKTIKLGQVINCYSLEKKQERDMVIATGAMFVLLVIALIY